MPIPFADDIELLNAIGISTDRLDAMQVYLLGCKLTRDDVLNKRAEEKMRASGNPNVLEHEFYVAAVREMTPTERLALRERLTGVVQLQTKQLGATTRAEVR